MNYTQLLSGSNMAQPISMTFGDIIPILALIVIMIVVKGLALWKSARLREKRWFWIMLIFNTAAILPAIYLWLRRNRKI